MSFWLVPAILAVAVVLLFLLTQYLDQIVEADLDRPPGRLLRRRHGRTLRTRDDFSSLITVVTTIFR